MSKKQIDTTPIMNELHGASAFFRQAASATQAQEQPPQVTPTPPSQSTQQRDKPRQPSRETSRQNPREISPHWPTRDEIQEFSFRLGDDLKVKVQAEVPHQWQDELEEVARQLDVKKLELYRFILGEFLGKVKRKAQS